MDERDVRLNWRDDTGDTVAVTLDKPTGSGLDYVDRLMDAWAASKLPFNTFMANLPTYSRGVR